MAPVWGCSCPDPTPDCYRRAPSNTNKSCLPDTIKSLCVTEVWAGLSTRGYYAEIGHPRSRADALGTDLDSGWMQDWKSSDGWSWQRWKKHLFSFLQAALQLSAPSTITHLAQAEQSQTNTAAWFHQIKQEWRLNGTSTLNPGIWLSSSRTTTWRDAREDLRSHQRERKTQSTTRPSLCTTML